MQALPVPTKCFDDPQLHLFAKPTNDPLGMPENNLQKSFSAEKDRTSNVAKIKVVVFLFFFFLIATYCALVQIQHI